MNCEECGFNSRNVMDSSSPDSSSRNNSDGEKNDELDAKKRIIEITSDAYDFIDKNASFVDSGSSRSGPGKNCNLDCIDFTMETDRKHSMEKNLVQFDQYSVDSGKSYELSRDTLSEQLTRIENDANVTNRADNKISRIFDNLIDAMKITGVLDDVRNNDPDFSSFCSLMRKSDLSYSRDDLFVSDDGYPRLYQLFNNLASSNLSPPEPMTCSLERSNSWQFCSFSSKHPSVEFSCSSSTSSICSFTQFNQILRLLKDNDAIDETDPECGNVSRFSTFDHRRSKSAPVKRSYSDSDLRKLDGIQIQSTFNDFRLPNTYSRYTDNTELGSDHGHVSCKRTKIDSSISLTSINSINCQAVINWLAEESDTKDTLLGRSSGSNGLPRQPLDKLWAISDADDHRSTLRTDVMPGRMRSRSVTLERRRTAADAMSRRSRQMERSYSIDVMDSSRGLESEKRSQRMSNRDYRSSEIEDGAVSTSAVRPARSWMRASMRLVRPFHLADPPSPPAISQRPEPVQIHLPPVFPCDLVERPCSAPTPERPRQYGRSGQRRLSSRVSSVSSESPATSFSASESWHVPASPTISRTESRRSSVSEAPTFSRNESVSSTTTQSTNQPQAPAQDDTGAYEMSQESESPLGQWSHGLSSMLACVGCTLGIFNISRFAIFSIHFGANFILQFLVLTVLIGIPLFTFHISLGQLLGTGVLNMWHISPIFKGIGVAILLSQAFIGIYSIIGVSWMFVYFKDSFISKQDVYRWAEPLELYGEDGVRTLKYNNGSYKIEQTVPDYFSGVVLQRRNVLKQEDDLMNVKFSVAFNLAIVWIIIFLSLSKGLKSYGKVVYVFSILPIFGMTLLCAKLLGFLPGTAKSRNFFPETDWSEFFLNSKSWVAAFTEVFLTWGVFGASAMQITSHNRQKHFLYRDSALVIVITVSVLLLSAFIANMCSQLLEYNNFLYLPSSFERSTTYLFLQRMDIPLPYSYATTPIRWMIHSGLILGERTIKPGTNPIQESGYQPLRLATELVPATFAAIGPKIISPFWSVLFYFIFIMFGISQQMAIWYGVISNIVTINVKALKPCWTTITWFTCIGGFILGLPMTMETGIFVVYFLDFVVGCGWWIMILYLLQLGAVFIVRGRPYSGETIVATLFTRSNYFLQNWIAPMFSFNWNVILPVTLLLLSTSVFKNGGYRMLYNWHSSKYYEYWPLWSRKCGCLLQILPLFTVPLVGIIQSYLYLTDGPLDLFERIQQLYRPVLETNSNLRSPNVTDTESNTRSSGNNNTNVTVNDDPPPKYTPPPSYSTATGARIAKLLRQSFRRSVIRIAHVLGTSDSNPSTSEDHPTSQRQLPPPPDYSTVLVEINQSLRGANLSSINSINPSNMSINDSTTHRNDDASSTLTAQDVANILRSSLRRNRTLPVHNNLVEQECTSIQCLVESAAPINQDSIIMLDELKTQQT